MSLSSIYLEKCSIKNTSYLRCIVGGHELFSVTCPLKPLSICLKFDIQVDGVHLRNVRGVCSCRIGCPSPDICCVYSSSLRSMVPVLSPFLM